MIIDRSIERIEKEREREISMIKEKKNLDRNFTRKKKKKEKKERKKKTKLTYL